MTKGTTIRAAIWDVDGVIVDSRDMHFRAWQRLLGEMGRTLTYEAFLPTFGRKNADILRGLIGGELTDDQVEELAERKERYFREAIKPDLHPLPGVRELVDDFNRAGFRQAVASSAPPENVDLILETLHLAQNFSVRVSADDIDQGKPNPQVFLLAAQRLGVPPRRCVVIEDSVPGVQAGRAANMVVIAVTTTSPREDLREANLIVPSLEEVDAATAEALLDDETAGYNEASR